MAGDEHLRLRVLQHILQALVGILKVQGRIGSTGLMDGQHAEWELLIAVEHHADEVVRPHTCCHQSVGQHVRMVRQLAVCQLAALVDDSHVVGHQLGTLLKDLGKRLGDVYVKVFSLRQGYHVAGTMPVEQRYRRQRCRLWCLLGNTPEQVCQLQHVFLGIQCRVIFQHHQVVITLWSHRYVERELGLVELQAELFARRYTPSLGGAGGWGDFLPSFGGAGGGSRLERVHDLWTDTILIHHLRKRIEVARLRLQQLVVHLPDSLCHTRRTVGRRAHGGNGLYEHTHRAHHPHVRTSVVDGGDRQLILTRHGMQHVHQDRQEITVRRYALFPAECRNVRAPDGQRGPAVIVTARRLASRHCHAGLPLQQIPEVAVSLGIPVRCRQPVFIQRKVKGSIRLLFHPLPTVCFLQVGSQEHRRRTVVNRMVDIHEQPYRLSERINLQPVQRVFIQIERADTTLEEGRVRLLRQLLLKNFHRFFIAANLHDVASMLYKARLQVRMGVEHLHQSIVQPLGIAVLKHQNLRNIILCGVTVHLPVEDDTALVLCDRIIIA